MANRQKSKRLEKFVRKAVEQLELDATIEKVTDMKDILSYGVMSTGLRYSEFLAQALDAKSINGGKAGSCNQRIFRTTVRDLLKLRQQTDEPILCVLCLGSLIRGEWWNEAKQPLPNETDGHFESFQTI